MSGAKYMTQQDILATLCAGVMEEYQKFMDEEGEKSVDPAELEALSREISNFGNSIREESAVEGDAP